MSISEFNRLSAFRCCLERFERSIPGVGLLYLHTIWWRCEFNPDHKTIAVLSRHGPFLADRLLVLAFIAVQITCTLWIVASLHPAQTPWVLAEACVLGSVLPFFVWNWLMGFITYQHHTHPNVAWFDKQEEWTSACRQLDSTVHIVFPAVINALFLYIMEHTAHHVNPIIPLYRLRGCQAALSAAVRHYVWSPKQCLDTFARCKLYDYKNHQWQDFDGVPTSAPSLAGQFELGNGVFT